MNVYDALNFFFWMIAMGAATGFTWSVLFHWFTID